MGRKVIFMLRWTSVIWPCFSLKMDSEAISEHLNFKNVLGKHPPSCSMLSTHILVTWPNFNLILMTMALDSYNFHTWTIRREYRFGLTNISTALMRVIIIVQCVPSGAVWYHEKACTTRPIQYLWTLTEFVLQFQVNPPTKNIPLSLYANLQGVWQCQKSREISLRTKLHRFLCSYCTLIAHYVLL